MNIKLPTSFKAGGERFSIEYKATTLEIDIDANAIARDLGIAAAEAVRESLQDATGRKGGTEGDFKDTGKLLHGITSTREQSFGVNAATGESDVVAPPGRLETVELMDRFRETVRVARDPDRSPKILNAIEKACAGIVKVGH